MKTAWSHLPNAVHIDRILINLRSHPYAWSSAWDIVLSEPMRVVWEAARKPAWDAARAVEWNAARNLEWDAAARNMEWKVADLIVALIAWDESSNYLSMSSHKLRTWIAISNDPAATLLLPAVCAFETELYGVEE